MHSISCDTTITHLGMSTVTFLEFLATAAGARIVATHVRKGIVLILLHRNVARGHGFLGVFRGHPLCLNSRLADALRLRCTRVEALFGIGIAYRAIERRLLDWRDLLDHDRSTKQEAQEVFVDLRRKR